MDAGRVVDVAVGVFGSLVAVGVGAAAYGNAKSQRGAYEEGYRYRQDHPDSGVFGANPHSLESDDGWAWKSGYDDARKGRTPAPARGGLRHMTREARELAKDMTKRDFWW